MLKAGIYVSKCTELEIDLISNVHQEGSHVGKNEGNSNDHIDIGSVLTEEADQVTCANFPSVNAMAALLERRQLRE